MASKHLQVAEDARNRGSQAVPGPYRCRPRGGGLLSSTGRARAADGSATTHDSSSRPGEQLGRTGVEVSAIGLGGYSLGDALSLDEANRSLAKRSMLASISSTTRGSTTTAAAKSGWAMPRRGCATRSSHDQSLHPRPRQGGGDAATGAIAQAASRPTTSTSGRSMNASTSMTRTCTLPKAESSKLSTSEESRQGSVRRLYRAQGPGGSI